MQDYGTGECSYLFRDCGIGNGDGMGFGLWDQDLGFGFTELVGFGEIVIVLGWLGLDSCRIPEGYSIHVCGIMRIPGKKHSRSRSKL